MANDTTGNKPQDRGIDPAAPSQLEVVLIQLGASGLDKAQNVAEVAGLIEAALSEHPADFVLLSELATSPYFCATRSSQWFEWAEPVPGPTTEVFAQIAARHKANILLPLYERGPRRGEFYNSLAILDRNGQLVPGTLPDGTQVQCYRKCHIPNSFLEYPGYSEKYFFKPGPGLPVFTVDGLTVGVLICYDRSFPEAWKMLSVQGADLVFVSAASSGKLRVGSYVQELQTMAVQNGVFVLACNKGGVEHIEDDVRFFGKSSIIDPFGVVLAEGPSFEGPATIRATLGLTRLQDYSTRFFYMRDRRPEIYSLLGKVTHH